VSTRTGWHRGTEDAEEKEFMTKSLKEEELNAAGAEEER
jgi:hypothetical protein